MPFSRLLLIAANTKKYIVGKRHEDKVELKPQKTPHHQVSSRSNELVLFFQIDEDKIRHSLRMVGDGAKCCDGLIFYARDGQAEKVICLVEMKGTNTEEAPAQIGETRQKLKSMLEAEQCSDYMQHIVWKACIYSSGPVLVL